MLLKEIGESLIRTVSAALKTDEDRYEPDFVDDLVHTYRAKAIWEIWRVSKRLNPIWTQQFIAEFSQDLQDDDCLVRFVCPPAISLDNKRDGFLYIGTIQGNEAYRKVISRAGLANADQHRITKLNGRLTKALYSDGFLEIYGKPLIRDVRVDGIFANPTDVPAFNPAFDPYPLDDNTLTIMKNLLIQAEMVPMASAQPDMISDSNDIKRNI